MHGPNTQSCPPGETMPEQSLFEAARGLISRSFIESHFRAPGAHWVGGNYMTLNPARRDAGLGSFSIREDGKYYDFATKDGGDVFDLIAATEGRPVAEVVRDLVGGGSYAPPARAAQAPAPAPAAPMAPDWKPIPAGALPPFRSAPSLVTVYPDPASGEDMFIVARHDLPDGKKEIYPIYYDGAGFRKGLPPSLKQSGVRPLLPVSGERTVLVVEGEKKCKMAQDHLEGLYDVTCWHGGASAADKVEVGPLRGCDVILWPDNDDVGREAMKAIALALKGKAHVRWLEPPAGLPKAWDVADAIIEGRDIRTMLAAAADFEFPAPPEGVGPEILPMVGPFPLTDLGNAERFVALFGHEVRHNADKNAWIVWNGKRWDDSDQSAITPKVKRSIRSIADSEEVADIAHAMKSESSGAIRSMLALASVEPGIPVREEDLDPDPFIFNCQNGMIDLRTGELLPHDRLKLCSKIARIEYDPKAECPRFLDFLNDITLGRADYVNFLQRWFGYSMTADVSAQTFVICYGNGANGKSTLVELIARIMGDYGKSAAPDTFIQKAGGSGIPNDVAALRGARSVLTTETEANARLAESRIKSMTGGDMVTARFMRAEFFTFRPTWKIIISTNHRPKISGADYGIWRRIVLLPFEFIAKGDKLDPRLSEKLWAERTGVLKWMVEGARKWAEDGMGRVGLAISDDLSQETQEYREDEDVIGRFISQACWSRGEAGFDLSKMTIDATNLHRAFTSWANDEGELFAAKMSMTAFGRALLERGYDKKRGTGGRTCYIGLIPKTQEGGGYER